MKQEIEKFSVILDTSFLIRLLSRNDDLNRNAMGYYRYFLEHKIPMYISTISIAEYCVKGVFNELPLSTLRILPFNSPEAIIAGRFAHILFVAKHNGEIHPEQRNIIPNDVKLFAQSQQNNDIKYFVTSDTESSHLIDTIKAEEPLTFEHMDIHTEHNIVFGEIPLFNE